jgi:hypothetical protein
MSKEIRTAWILMPFVASAVSSPIRSLADEDSSMVQQSLYQTHNPDGRADAERKAAERRQPTAQLEQQMFDLIKQERSANGRDSFKLDPALTHLARAQSEDELGSRSSGRSQLDIDRRAIRAGSVVLFGNISPRHRYLHSQAPKLPCR